MRRLTRTDVREISEGEYQNLLARITHASGINLFPERGGLLLTPRGLSTSQNDSALKHLVLNILLQRKVKTVAFLHAAQDGAPEEERKELRESLVTLRQAGFDIREFPFARQDLTVREEVLACDCVYLCGGAPLWIAAYLEQIELHASHLRYYMKGGGLIVASSAGAMALGDNVGGLVNAGKLDWPKNAPEGWEKRRPEGCLLLPQWEQVVPHPTGFDALLVRLLQFSFVRRTLLGADGPVRVLWDGELHVCQPD